MSKELTPKETLQELLTKVKESLERANKAAKEYVTNKNYPLDDRWDLFLDLELGEDRSWIVHFKALNNGKWKQWCRNEVEDYLFDYKQRHETVHIEYLDESLHELIGHEFELDGPDYETRDDKRKVVFTQEDYDAWREEVLEMFLKSYRWDW